MLFSRLLVAGEHTSAGELSVGIGGLDKSGSEGVEALTEHFLQALPIVSGDLAVESSESSGERGHVFHCRHSGRDVLQQLPCGVVG